MDGAEELVVRVRDNGIGVPVEHRDRLFEHFFRGDAQSRGVEGTGLGLNLVQETVESLGGRAWAELEEEGSGAVFAFSMPYRRGGEAGVSSDPAAAASTEGRPRKDEAREKAYD